LPTPLQSASSADQLFADQLFPLQSRLKTAPKSGRCGTWFERQCHLAGFQCIAGVDEVGRGALFGPVLAAAVILDLGVTLGKDLPKNSSWRIRGIQDSKQLSVKERERLNEEIRRRAVAWSIASVDPGEIDRINIYQASRIAMRQAVLTLATQPEIVLVDALRLDVQMPQVAIIHGDALSITIAAASIIAKVERDRLLRDWDRIYPDYQLASNKGYATVAHREKLREFGPTPLHRFSYLPVAQAASREPVPKSGSLFLNDA